MMVLYLMLTSWGGAWLHVQPELVFYCQMLNHFASMFSWTMLDEGGYMIFAAATRMQSWAIMIMP